MARAKKMNRKKDAKEELKVQLGTTKEMVVCELETPIIKEINGVPRTLDVKDKDDKGEYLTQTSYVNAKLLDPYRQYHRIQA